MIEIRIGFGSVGIPGEEEIVANGDSLLDRKLRVNRFYHFQDGELTYWRSSTTDMDGQLLKIELTPWTFSM
ncbi:hypothetical protein CY35_14G043200 [Sphagnum magellanicum]|nr:hypothetical protein CY35_14G043200 [Sphagnum magellanicum]